MVARIECGSVSPGDKNQVYERQCCGIPIMGTLLILERVNTEDSHKGKQGPPCPDIESPGNEPRRERRV